MKNVHYLSNKCNRDLVCVVLLPSISVLSIGCVGMHHLFYLVTSEASCSKADPNNEVVGLETE